EYKQVPADKVLHENHQLTKGEEKHLVLALAPEPHDTVMEELLGLVITRGIKNAMSVVNSMGNPHIDDDFHRLLIQYIKTGEILPEFKSDSKLDKSLHMTLFEVTLPPASGEGDKEKGFKE